jgi:hypothetical protein
MVKGYKFGLLYSQVGQSTEEEFYLNCMFSFFSPFSFLLSSFFLVCSWLGEEGENYKEFKSWLAENITLKGWKGYTAGKY